MPTPTTPANHPSSDFERNLALLHQAGNRRHSLFQIRAVDVVAIPSDEAIGNPLQQPAANFRICHRLNLIPQNRRHIRKIIAGLRSPFSVSEYR